MATVENGIIIAAAFLLAGLVKGVTGLGMPTVSLAILTAALGLKPAMALLLVPAFVTNVWQALVGGHLGAILRRLWPLLLPLCLTTWLGVSVLARARSDLLAGLLGLAVLVYAVTGLTRIELPPPGRREGWLTPLVGAASGLLNGMTGAFVVPGVLYLQSLGLPREAFIQAMGVLFATSVTALAASLGNLQLLSPELALMSAGAVVPALVGMGLGQIVRRRLSDEVFRRIFFSALLLIGGYIVIVNGLKVAGG
jgi:uncharacterized membrane protein YfcA